MVQLTNRVAAPKPDRRPPAVRDLLAAVFLAGVAAIVIARWWTGTGYQEPPLGLPDAGGLTAIGLPIVQFVHDMAGIAVVGLLFVRCLSGLGHSGFGSSAVPAHQHLMAMAVRWAWLWAGSTLAWIVLTMSDLVGVPVVRLRERADVLAIVLGTDRVLTQIATLWVAVAIALFGARLSTVAATSGVLVLAIAALLPSALTGHAGHHNYSDVAVVALAVHITAASLWVGGLLALAVHLRAFPDRLQYAVPRFSAAALICVIAVGVSGVVESAVMLDDWAALWGTNRGHLIIAKVLALVVLGGIGWWHRQRTMGPAATGRLLPMLRLAAGELVLMGVTVGIAVVLSGTA
jgi:putative copper resistance protein D